MIRQPSSNERNPEKRNSDRLRIAVVGGGHLGTIHAKLLQQVPDAELCAIVEPGVERATELADEFECGVLTDVDKFVESANVDGVVIAAPTSLHHKLGMKLLSRSVPCLIEKPLTPSVQECSELVEAARENHCVLQVGHVERFNPVWTTMCEHMHEPSFIDATREAPLTFRSMDAGVVLDLMIHDIDLILSLVKSRVVSLQATGFNWTGPTEDIAQTRLTFANGCVAQIGASRVACEPKRQMRVFGRDWFGEIDFATRSCRIIHGPPTAGWQSRSYTPADRKHLMANLYDEVLSKQELAVPDGNPILDELRDFVTSIRTGTTPIVTGEAGLDAVDIAQQVIQRIATRQPQQSVPIFRAPDRKAG